MKNGTPILQGRGPWVPAPMLLGQIAPELDGQLALFIGWGKGDTQGSLACTNPPQGLSEQAVGLGLSEHGLLEHTYNLACVLLSLVLLHAFYIFCKNSSI